MKIIKFLNYIYPPKCPYCGNVLQSTSIGICQNCIYSVKAITKPITITNTGLNLCCVVPFEYVGKVREAILSYKFNHKAQLAEMFAASMIHKFNMYYSTSSCDVVTSVPRKEVLLAGDNYDHAKILAKKFAKLSGIRYKNVLKKIKTTNKQHRLNATEREINLKGAFVAINKKYINGKTIILCDDILTTGSTLRETSNTLLDSGAKKIICCVIASVNLKRQKI